MACWCRGLFLFLSILYVAIFLGLFLADGFQKPEVANRGRSCEKVPFEDISSYLGEYASDFPQMRLDCQINPGRAASITVRTSDIKRCAEECLKEPQCEIFDFKDTNHMCRLAMKKAGGIRNDISGVVGIRTSLPDPIQELQRTGRKIDVVYTWINGSHPEIVEANLAVKNISFGPSSSSMFRDYHILRYSMRSVEKYMPWVNHIYLVVNQGIYPDWMQLDNPRVTVVPHDQLFTDPEGELPTFNSRAIEMVLGRLPYASDCFIYMNDDMIITRDIHPSYFCDIERDVPRVFFEDGATGNLDTKWFNWHNTVQRTADLMATVDKVLANRFFTWHTVFAGSKKSAEQLYEMFPEQVNYTTHTKTRSLDDIMTPFSNAQFTLIREQAQIVRHPWLTGRCFQQLTSNVHLLKDVFNEMDTGKCYTMCMNDGFGEDGPTDKAVDFLVQELEKHFPNPTAAEIIYYTQEKQGQEEAADSESSDSEEVVESPTEPRAEEESSKEQRSETEMEEGSTIEILLGEQDIIQA